MSHQTGIKANENLRNFFAKSKDGHIRSLKVVINDKEELELDSFGESKHNDWQKEYNEYVLKSIEPKSPCYIFYRLDEKTNSGYMWLLVSWTPDFAPIKLKMLYAATKSTLKLEFGAGQIKDELFGTIKEDVSLEGYLKHLKAQLAPKPMTNREEELEILRQSENHTRINVDSKHKTLQGVMFPVEFKAVNKLESFQKGQIDYVQFEIDIKGEQILLDTYKERIDVNSLVQEIPNDKGRFHLYRYNHHFDNESFKSVVFIYSMPGFICSVKERMLYSSCKSELLQYLKTQASIDIAKTFEISEAAELTEDYLLSELHPKKLSDGLKFDKPKGPTSRGPRRVTRPSSNNNNASDLGDDMSDRF